jgi:hypothetical protein
MALRIEFNGTGDGETDSLVHFEDNLLDYTLCGLTLDGDPRTTGGYNSTNKKVTCGECIRIVKYCKSIRSTEYQK